MEIIKASALNRDYLNTGPNGIPIIICSDSRRVLKKIDEAGYVPVRVNATLAKALLEFTPAERPKKVEECFKDLIDGHGSVFITDFEMLFDPRYEIDVIKLFCEKARFVNVAVKWPGKYNAGKLTYANLDDPDYHEFDCDAYQVLIVE